MNSELNIRQKFREDSCEKVEGLPWEAVGTPSLGGRNAYAEVLGNHLQVMLL